MHCSPKSSAPSRTNMNMTNRFAVSHSIPWFPFDLGLFYPILSHPGGVSFFYHIAFLFPSCPIWTSEPRINIPSASTHAWWRFFFPPLLFVYHASAVPVTSSSPTVWSAWLDLNGGRPLFYSIFLHFFRLYWISDFKTASGRLGIREPTYINRRRQFWILSFLMLLQEKLNVDAACLMCNQLLLYGL